MTALRLVLLSDTHGRHDSIDVPAGDILVHAGDLTYWGDAADVDDFDRFLSRLPHRDKVVIAGNHDFCFEREPSDARRRLRSAIYLEDEAATVQGLTFYGSPWQPWFMDFAFNLERGAAIKEKWDRIPAGTDVLVTHGPPLGHGDRTVGGELVGCADLLDAVERVAPRLHVFGHIHEGAGRTTNGVTDFVNACVLNSGLRRAGAVQVYDIAL